MKVLKNAIPIKGSDSINGIISTMAEALNEGATKLLYDKNKPYIAYQKPLKETELEKTEQSEVYRIARLNELIDVGPVNQEGYKEYLFNMCRRLEKKDLYASYVLVQNKNKLRLKLDSGGYAMDKLNTFLGAKVYDYEELEDDIILICGTEVKNAEPYDIVLTIKGYLDVET